MVNYNEKLESQVFKALADPTRREILKMISRGNVTVSDLQQPFDISGPAISKHLKQLETATLITRIKDGKQRRFRLNTAPLEKAKATIDSLAAYWSKRLDNLEEFLKTKNTQT